MSELPKMPHDMPDDAYTAQSLANFTVWLIGHNGETRPQHKVNWKESETGELIADITPVEEESIATPPTTEELQAAQGRLSLLEHAAGDQDAPLVRQIQKTSEDLE